MRTSVTAAPRVVIFDWHGTLVDTFEPMYRAVEGMLPGLDALGLIARIDARTRTDDERAVVDYVREHRTLHPDVKAAKRLSRTDLFELLFGGDEEAKVMAHDAFNTQYRAHFGAVRPFAPPALDIIQAIKRLGVSIAVATNRNREFFDLELAALDDGAWADVFDATVCGDDVAHRKPAPDSIALALERVGEANAGSAWYVGDSEADISAAARAGCQSVFFNGAHWDPSWAEGAFAGGAEPGRPVLFVETFDDLFDHVHRSLLDAERVPPALRRAVHQRGRAVPLTPPSAVIFDWHATLADTLDAMYHAVDEVLPQLEGLGLAARLVPADQSKTPDDAKLVDYVRNRRSLHPKIKAERKISRTDIFEVLFGDDAEAKRIAHAAFNECYRHHYGNVHPFEPGARPMLERLRQLGLKVAVLTNREREFFDHELEKVEPGGWMHLFDATVCGNEAPHRKPAPDPIFASLDVLDLEPGLDAWYIGDSTTDVISSRVAGVTAVFYNGARWEPEWIDKIFPGTDSHPHLPHVVVDDFAELTRLIEASIKA